MFHRCRASATPAALLCLVSLVAAQTTATSAAGSCPTVLSPSGYSPPVVGSGYTAQLIVTGLTKPRGLIVDKNGGLLVVDSGAGIKHFTFTDKGGTCLITSTTTTLVDDPDLNHGIELSSDGRTLYASSSDEVYSWAYDPTAVTVSSKTTLVTNMSNTDHTTRTLLLSRKAPGLLLVSRGSAENMDSAAAEVTSGHSQIRVFNISSVPSTPYNFATDGVLLGWGLRNSVGVAEEPLAGGIYSVENSADQLRRQGTDIHENNPGEELNFHGFLNDTSPTTNEHLGQNYGYPDCFALWDTNVPNRGNMTTGSQFALNPSSTLNDTTCAADYVAPRLTFQAHMAPLDIKFTPDGTLAYISFHGSWDRDEPTGYKLSTVAFADGTPVAAPDATDAAVDILSNADNAVCPDHCFRPAGLALDDEGRVFMTSDATGEIYVLQQAEITIACDGDDGDGQGSTSATTAGTLVTATGGPTSHTPSGAAGGMGAKGGKEWVLVMLTAALAGVAGAMLIAA